MKTSKRLTGDRTERFLLAFMQAARKNPSGSFEGAWYIRGSNFDKRTTADLLRELVARGMAIESGTGGRSSDFFISEDGKRAIDEWQGGLGTLGLWGRAMPGGGQ